MIIGNELAKVLKDFNVKIDEKEVPVKFEYGDQSALEMFIEYAIKKQLQKFPLVFYVTNQVADHNGRLECATDLVILSKTKHEQLSQVRYVDSFERFINPIYKDLIKKIDRSKTLILNKKEGKINYVDKANYGISENGITQETESKVTEYVDARIIKVNIEYSEGC